MEIKISGRDVGIKTREKRKSGRRGERRKKMRGKENRKKREKKKRIHQEELVEEMQGVQPTVLWKRRPTKEKKNDRKKKRGLSMGRMGKLLVHIMMIGQSLGGEKVASDNAEHREKKMTVSQLESETMESSLGADG